ncbi:hypothetical protein [Variovorax sp. PAMC 28711]|nr:hypothetical protein [Variovorax sp. PAMC 28711]
MPFSACAARKYNLQNVDGLPPAVALQQQRGTPSTRSSLAGPSHIL